MLNQTNIDNNANKYYVIQVIESAGRYYVWNRWGRVVRFIYTIPYLNFFERLDARYAYRFMLSVLPLLVYADPCFKRTNF